MIESARNRAVLTPPNRNETRDALALAAANVQIAFQTARINAKPPKRCLGCGAVVERPSEHAC